MVSDDSTATPTAGTDAGTGPVTRSQRLAKILAGLDHSRDGLNYSRGDAEEALRANIAEQRGGLEALAARLGSQWVGEDLVYRFWHHSFKVYALQDTTLAVAAALEALAPPGTELNPWFRRLVEEGTGRVFTPEVNDRWFDETKPIVDAFFHARHLLEMVLAHGDEPSGTFITSGWATVLTLYGIR